MNLLSPGPVATIFTSSGLLDYFTINSELEPGLKKAIFKRGTFKIGLGCACAIAHLVQTKLLDLAVAPAGISLRNFSGTLPILHLGWGALAAVDLSLGALHYIDNFSFDRASAFYCLSAIDKTIYAVAYYTLYHAFKAASDIESIEYLEYFIKILGGAGLAQYVISTRFESRLNSLFIERLPQKATVNIVCVGIVIITQISLMARSLQLPSA